MKKTFKGLSAILMTSVLAVSASAASVASMTASADYTVTITKPESDTATHTYEAYLVFSGTLHGTGEDAVLSDVDWGSGVKGTELLTALTSATVFGSTNPFASCADAKAVAEVIDNLENDSDNLKKFADIVSQHLNTVTVSGTAGNPELTMTSPGYYFIKDKDGTQNNAQLGAYTDYMLKVVDSISVKAKEDVPTIGKKIGTDYETGVAANTASIGDTVNFVLDSRVPDMSAYSKYYFIINDTMCEGLTFDPNSVKVYIDDMNNPITASNYEVQTEADAKVGDVQYTFQIVMKDFKTNYGNKANKPIKVTYSATLNKDADRSTLGNDNNVNLTYSNNPNVTPTGVNEPSSTDTNVTGKTPDSQTKTYTTGIMFTKIDGATSQPLTGAKFELKGSGVNKVIITKAENFTEDTSGEFYKLKDNTFTKTPPTPATESQYASTTIKYKLTGETLSTHTGTGDDSAVTATVDSNGVLTFEGLGTGTYTLTELTPPSGYNTISPITITISATPTLTGPEWTVLKGSETLAAPHGIYTFEIENNKGVTLPGTGGVGTTIFYIVGGLMISGALVLLIVKKRMNIKEK